MPAYFEMAIKILPNYACSIVSHINAIWIQHRDDFEANIFF
jgi:hypothetical protein